MSSTPTRLREIEVLEKVAEKGRLSVVVGEGGLVGRVFSGRLRDLHLRCAAERALVGVELGER